MLFVSLSLVEKIYSYPVAQQESLHGLEVSLDVILHTACWTSYEPLVKVVGQLVASFLHKYKTSFIRTDLDLTVIGYRNKSSNFTLFCTK